MRNYVQLWNAKNTWNYLKESTVSNEQYKRGARPTNQLQQISIRNSLLHDKSTHVHVRSNRHIDTNTRSRSQEAEPVYMPVIPSGN